ncbi:hypothetical protein F5Y18DRAFT_324615 [Xylariaceae sp. FL1019]|nr:hypothetical protein F5Y18DRAFT_324615 [Xylariaceae sp. FL1019]
MASQQPDAAENPWLTLAPLTTTEETSQGDPWPSRPFLAEDKFSEIKGCDQAELRRFDCLNTVDTAGDTLIIVRFPTGTQNYVNCIKERWTTKEFFFESHKLLATGSRVFKNLLSPKAQAQALRNNDSHPDLVAKVKFILDLTPKSEEIEAAQLVIDLSLSQGVRDWWLSHDIACAPEWLVCGHDDDCPGHAEIPTHCKHLPELYDGNLFTRNTIDDFDIPPSRKISDYCPIRHRAAILRLLLAIDDGEVVLNSAPRVATMAVIARHFDCINVMQSQVLQWFLTEGNLQNRYYNADFIDINTEDTLKIGWLLEIPSLTRIAFRLLVVENAVNVLTRGVKGECGERQEVKLRCSRGTTLTEEQQTCIEHAGRKLADRTATLWSDLTSTFPKAHRLFCPVGYEANPMNPDKNLLLGRIRDLIADTMIMAVDPPTADQLAGKDEIKRHYIPYSHFVSSRTIDAQLLPVQRILTKTFWDTFRDCTLPNLTEEKLLTESWLSLLHWNPEMLELRKQFERELRNLITSWAAPDIEVQLRENRLFVLGLSDEELNFLPPWAGGLNDDSAHIFNTEVPPDESGFLTAPGPSICIGQSVEGYDDDGQSTIGPDTAITGTGTNTEGFSIRPAVSGTLSDFSDNQMTDYDSANVVDPPNPLSVEPQDVEKGNIEAEDMDMDMLYYSDEENDWDWDNSDDQGTPTGGDEATIDVDSTEEAGPTTDLPIRSRQRHSVGSP